MLAVARAIVEPSELLLIDEPSKGLAPSIIRNLIDAFGQLKRQDTTILLVEQNFQMARALGDRVAVMDDGRVVHAGAMAELAETERCSSGCWACRWGRINEHASAAGRAPGRSPAGPPRRELPPGSPRRASIRPPRRRIRPGSSSRDEAAELKVRPEFDWKPLALLGALLLGAWPLIGSTSTWVTLSVAGLAMG